MGAGWSAVLVVRERTAEPGLHAHVQVGFAHQRLTGVAALLCGDVEHPLVGRAEPADLLSEFGQASGGGVLAPPAGDLVGASRKAASVSILR